MSSTRTHSPVDTVDTLDTADTDQLDNTVDDDYDGGSGAGPDIGDPDSGLGNQLERLQVQVLMTYCWYYIDRVNWTEVNSKPVYKQLSLHSLSFFQHIHFFLT